MRAGIERVLEPRGSTRRCRSWICARCATSRREDLFVDRTMSVLQAVAGALAVSRHAARGARPLRRAVVHVGAAHARNRVADGARRAARAAARIGTRAGRRWLGRRAVASRRGPARPRRALCCLACPPTGGVGSGGGVRAGSCWRRATCRRGARRGWIPWLRCGPNERAAHLIVFEVHA